MGIGCFKDRGQRDLPGLYDKSTKRVKRADCFARARELGFKYVGHQYGGECWYANKFGAYGQVDDAECNMDCKLEPDMRPKCGGGWRNSVFSIEQFTPEEKKINEAKEIN